VSAGVITREELESGLREQSNRGLRLGETLIATGLIDEAELLPYLADQMEVPYVLLRDGLVDPKVVKLIPQTMAESIGCLTMCRVRNRLAVAMTDPTDLSKIDQIAQVSGLQVRPILALGSAIENLLSRCYEEGFEVDSVTADMDAADVSVSADAFQIKVQKIGTVDDGTPYGRGQAICTSNPMSISLPCGSELTASCGRCFVLDKSFTQRLFRESR
ncbi:MAG TPA: hypothetical protein EYO33_31515, partial [Phycisphaerales bacterium]|nr:hypothetical protein [Phycisphaerales bacterium]